MKSMVALGLIGALAAPLTAAGAQSDDNRATGIITAIAACRSLPDSTRLACLDQVTATLLSANEQREIKIIDRESVRRSKRSVFGFSLPHINLFGSSKEDMKADADTNIKQITGTITHVQAASYGLWTFSLSEGGTWQSISQSMSFTPRVDDVITIKAGLLGHYTAKIGSQQAIDVKRLR